MTTMSAPKRSSGSPKQASSAATITSQASASSQPSASAGPRTAAIVGFERCQKRITVSKSSRSTARHWATPSGGAAACSLRSKPDENTPPAPVKTSTAMASSASTASHTSLSSTSMVRFMALARSGRLSVTRPTASRRSKVMHW